MLRHCMQPDDGNFELPGSLLHLPRRITPLDARIHAAQYAIVVVFVQYFLEQIQFHLPQCTAFNCIALHPTACELNSPKNCGELW